MVTENEARKMVRNTHTHTHNPTRTLMVTENESGEIHKFAEITEKIGNRRHNRDFTKMKQYMSAQFNFNKHVN